MQRIEAHRMVAVGDGGVAGIFVSVDRGGCRSSGELGVEATTAVALRGWHLWLLRGAASTLNACPGPNGHRSVAGVELVRR